MNTSLDESSARAILHIFHQEVKNYAAPIYWIVNPYCANSVLNNGTCFAVKISGKIIGITACHVLYGGEESYFAQKENHPDLELVIRNLRITNMEERIIDYDPYLDVVTFSLTEDDVKKIGFRVYERTAEKWPPSPPDIGKGIVFMGFPGEKRKVINKKVIEFEGASNCLVVTDVGLDHLDIQIRLKDLRPLYGESIPALDRNLGGYSGAPVWVVSSGVSELWWPGGMIYQMPRNLGADENGEEVVYLIARRVNFINPDGTLKRGNQSV
jgi:hypothetical protein